MKVKFNNLSRKEIFLFGSFSLILATIVQLIVMETIDHKIKILEFERKSKEDFFYQYEIRNLEKDHSVILLQIELLESMAFVGLFSEDQKKKIDSYNTVKDTIDCFGYGHYLERRLLQFDKLIKKPELMATQDSIMLEYKSLCGSDKSIIERSTQINELVDMMNDLCIKQVFMFKAEFDDIVVKLRGLSAVRNGFYYVFVMAQIIGLIFVGFSQLMKE